MGKALAPSLTLTQAAARLQVDRRTLRAWARDGSMRAHKTQGGHWRFRPQDLASPRDLTPRQYARRVGVHPLTARRWCVLGLLEGAHTTPGGHWRIPAHLADHQAGNPTTDRILGKPTTKSTPEPPSLAQARGGSPD